MELKSIITVIWRQYSCCMFMEWKNFEFLNGMINGIAMLTAAPAHSTPFLLQFALPNGQIDWRKESWRALGPFPQYENLWFSMEERWGSEPFNFNFFSISSIIEEMKEMKLWMSAVSPGGSNQQQSSISFQQINQQIKLFWFDGLIVDEMKSCWFAPPTKPAAANSTNQFKKSKLFWFHWLMLNCWTARLGRPAGWKRSNTNQQTQSI